MTAVTGSTQKPYVSEQPKKEQPTKAKFKISFNGKELKPENIGPPLTDKEVSEFSKCVNEAMRRFEKTNS